MSEILSPCGSMETLMATLKSGANAVYLGGKNFSARQNATNFGDDELKIAVEECHKRGVKIYQAINTIVMDDELEKCADIIKYACEIGIDGLIIQDLCVLTICRESCPQMPCHASTQMTIHTENGAMQASEMGYTRVVVSRELPENIIKSLCKLPVEIEAFVHGALCMSVSGQCYMSAVIGSRSANRGLCAQACRLPCSAIDGEERWDLSLKDMSYISHLRDMDNMGVASMKIEGRMKRPEYVACATDASKKALQGEKVDYTTLESVFSRGGFTEGYYTSKLGREMFGTRQKEDVEATSKVLSSLHELYRHERKCTSISFDIIIHNGEPVKITAYDGDGNKAEVIGEVAQNAINKAVDEQYLEKQLSKLGDTIYTFNSLSADIHDGLAVASSELNRLRREITQMFDTKRIEANTHIKSFADFHMPKVSAERKTEPKIRISVCNANQLEGADLSGIDKVIFPLSQADEFSDYLSAGKGVIELPRFTFDEGKIIAQLTEARDMGYTQVYATNLAHIRICRQLGMQIHAGYGFNITNTLAIEELEKMGVSDTVVSFELKATQINQLGGKMARGIIAYGRLALMLTANCPIKQAVGCAKCTGHVTDRTKRMMPVKCSRESGYVEILNSEKLYLSDKLDSFTNVDFIQLDFFDENAEKINTVINEYKNGKKPAEEKITRGLYFRGVI